MFLLSRVCRVSIRLIFGIAFAFSVAYAASAASEDVQITGEITSVDLTAIISDGPAVVTIRTANHGIQTVAVPSQGRNLCVARHRLAAPEEMRVGDLVTVHGTRSEDGAIVPCDDASHALFLMSLMSVPEHGFQFAFRMEPNGYVMIPNDRSESAALVYGISLISRDEQDTLSDATEARDGPKAISLEVYRNTEHLHAPVWVDRNQTLSSINLLTSHIEETVFAGANAVRYRTDGLHQNEYIVAASDSKIFLLTVMYDSPEDDIYRDFSELIASFEFIPPQ